MFIENNLRVNVNRKIPIPTTKDIGFLYYIIVKTPA